MAIGERIRYIRNLRGKTQMQLGKAVGFDDRTADVRMAQYESGTRTPKEKMMGDIARALDVSPFALNVPEIDSYNGLMHTLFALEDIYGIQIGMLDDELCLRLDRTHKEHYNMFEKLRIWNREAKKLRSDEITKMEYDDWRYNFPRVEADRFMVEVRESRQNMGNNQMNY